MQLTAGRTGTLSHAAGFWVVAYGFLLVMSLGTVPTPLYVLYQARDHFSSATLTVVFAAYAVGVLISLFLLGHLSDIVGRRRMLLPAVLVSGLAGAMFVFWSTLPGLLVARVLTGVSVGMITSTATVHLAELHRAARPASGTRRAEVTATVANLGGLGLGPLVAGLLADFAPRPLHVPYLVYLVLLVVLALVISRVPETVDVPGTRPPYRVRRISVPPAQRRSFFAASASAFVAFAVFGLFAALGPSVILTSLHESSHTLGGLATTAALGIAATVQALVRDTTGRRTLRLGFAALPVGFGLAIVAVWLGSLALFLISALAGGAGAGLVFAASVKVVADAAAPENRAEALAGLFLAAYLGITIPVVGLGVTTRFVSQPAALTAFGVVMGAAAVAAGAAVLRPARADRKEATG